MVRNESQASGQTDAQSGDEGLEIRKAVQERLIRQKQAVAEGETGQPFEDVVRRLGLD